MPAGTVILVETVTDAEKLVPPKNAKLAYITQTTLSVEDAAEIIAVLKRRFPTMPVRTRKTSATPRRTGRKRSKRSRRVRCRLRDRSANSSNSMRLVEVARRAGAKRAELIENAGAIDWERWKVSRPSDFGGRIGAGSAGRAGDRRLRRASI
jgi:4-hydroxy-3-methylbut-2-enyl diphosphate reductase